MTLCQYLQVITEAAKTSWRYSPVQPSFGQQEREGEEGIYISREAAASATTVFQGWGTNDWINYCQYGTYNRVIRG